MEHQKTCSVDGCLSKIKALGLCLKHYTRLRRHGDVTHRLRAANGEPIQWIMDNVHFQNDECLPWPYASGGRGDAVVFHDGRMRSASRVMCEMAHGVPDPSLSLECAHNCGNGHLGCMNPKHLRWDTRSGNHSDKVIHGTHNRGERNLNAKVSEIQALEIMASKESLSALSKKYGISVSAVSAIRTGKNWKYLKVQP